MKILVVDDEALARARAIRMLSRIQDVVVAGEAENGTIALEKLASNSFDVVLLDVDMPGIDGLAVAETPGMPAIVFTTAHAQYATDAFDLDAVDYLIKPLRQDRLERALEKVRRRAASAPVAPVALASETQIAVHGSGTVRFLDARNITAFASLDKYTAFTLNGEQLLVRESLDALEARLAPFGFVRVHRSNLIRRDAVVELLNDGGVLTARLSDGTLAEVSRRNAADLRRALGVRK